MDLDLNGGQGRNRTTDTRIFNPITAILGASRSITCDACQPRPQPHPGTTPAHPSTQAEFVTFLAHRRPTFIFRSSRSRLFNSLTTASTRISIRLFIASARRSSPRRPGDLAPGAGCVRTPPLGTVSEVETRDHQGSSRISGSAQRVAVARRLVLIRRWVYEFEWIVCNCIDYVSIPKIRAAPVVTNSLGFCPTLRSRRYQ